MVSSVWIRGCRVDLFLDSDAATFARKLDGLPLALATAGAYLD